MNLQNRVERAERERAGDELVRFRVIVPPKMSREEWERQVREFGRAGSRLFTVDLTGAGRPGGEDE